VLSVVWKPPCHLSPGKGARSIAENVTLNKENLAKVLI